MKKEIVLLYLLLLIDLLSTSIYLLMPAPNYTMIDQEVFIGIILLSLILLPLYIISMIKLFMLKNSGRMCYLVYFVLGLPLTLYISSVENTGLHSLIIPTIILILIFFTRVKKEFD